MNVHPIPDEELGNTAYLVEVGRGEAISIDPRRDADDHVRLAAAHGVRIVAVLETHVHADFVSGARELAATTGARILAAAAADVVGVDRAVAPGERLTFGDVTVEVLATPGHTPEHVAYHVTGATPAAVFSGGSLIVGGAARTDLSGEERTDELARAQYRSVRALVALPGETALYPTHGGGSFCSTTSARSTSSTIAGEVASNPLVAVADEDAFVEALRAGFGTYPTYFAHLPAANRAGMMPLLDALPSVRALTASQAIAAIDEGAWLIDGRPVSDWARAHPAAAVSIAFRDSFASWLGWIVPFGAPVVLVLAEPDVEAAVTQARRIGYDAIAGWLPFEGWLDAGLPTASIEQIDPEDAAARVAAGDATLLDVRQAHEYRSRHLAGATHLELSAVIAGTAPPARDVITYCAHGERSATAASLLASRGVEVRNLRGGATAWRAAGLPVEP